ncbi:MAG: T9SS type A sorting domain-containing protein, partial [Saprospiraceae bacterium]
GPEAMSVATDFVIIEDHVMLDIPPTVGPLLAGESIEFPRAANGSTYRIFANQTPDHPGDSRPTTAIEGCVAGGGSFSTGFVNQFSEDDYDHFLSVDCQENTNASSPNESRGYPKGYNSVTDSQTKNEISKCIDLKYIHRFQNTGPDTAIRVVIQDTLSRFLDPASVRPGASSHDYVMEVYACGILRFTFDNIFLPGSSTDPQASQVFVKYRVSQRPNNPAGAIVDNSAAIYFDYQAPIKTDSIYHTIADGCAYEDYVDMDSTSHAIYLEAVQDVNLFPNPFQEEMMVEIIADIQMKDAAFKVYDLTGRLVRRETFSGNTFQFSRNNMTAGMYVYLIEMDGQKVSSGKIVVQ